MAHITKEKSSEIRKALKAAFPGWKFSVRIDHHSSLNCTVKSAPYDLFDYYAPVGYYRDPINLATEIEAVRKNGHTQVNHYHIDSSWKGPAAADLTKIVEICNSGNHDNSDIMTDYFDVGWWFHLSIGEWNAPAQFGASTFTKKAA